MKNLLDFFKSLSIEDFAFEIFGIFLVLDVIFYFLKYYDFKMAAIIFIIIILSWLVYFIRLKEELKINANNEN